MRGLGIGLGAALCVVLGANAARAQAPSTAAFRDSPAPAPAPPTTPAPTTPAPTTPAPSTPAPSAAPEVAAPDVVRLKNGGLLRGTVSELVPGGTVTIVTVTGATRVFNLSEVTYAGPAAQDPQAAPAQPPAAAPPSPPGGPQRWEQPPPEGQQQPYVTVHAPEARVQFRSVEEGTTFYRRSGSAYSEVHFAWRSGSAYSKGYERICTAPCEASLPAGTETIAYGHNDGEPKELDTVTLKPGTSQLRLKHVSNPGAHKVGMVAIIAGPVLAGVSLALLGYEVSTSKCDPDTCSDAEKTKQLVLVYTFVASLSVGLGLGIPMLAVGKERPRLEVRPADSATSRLQQLQGVTFSGKF